jgi:uncharacterized OB-fold protein
MSLPPEVVTTLAAAGYDPRDVFAAEWHRNFFTAELSAHERLLAGQCSYCRTERDPARERCKTCGAPAS